MLLDPSENTVKFLSETMVTIFFRISYRVSEHANQPKLILDYISLLGRNETVAR